MALTTQGILDKASNHSVEQTVDRLKNILQSKGVTLFALVDHSGEAAKVGMKMPPTKLLIFGSPKAGGDDPGLRSVGVLEAEGGEDEVRAGKDPT